MTEIRPVYPIHRGQILADELAEIQMTPAAQRWVYQLPSIYQNRLEQEHLVKIVK